jgi:hypothetical protein
MVLAVIDAATIALTKSRLRIVVIASPLSVTGDVAGQTTQATADSITCSS